MNRAFQYDLSSEEWIECTDENFINSDIEKVPSVLVLRYLCLEDYVYCLKHHSIEKIRAETDSEIVSFEGCKFKDFDRLHDKKLLYCPIHKQFEEIILIDGNEIITDTFCKFNSLIGFGWYVATSIPIRWRIFQPSDKEPINIAVDVAEIINDNSRIKIRWNNFFIAVSLMKKITVIKKIKKKSKDYWGNLRVEFLNWTEVETHIKIPEIVIDAAMETLLNSTKAIYGFRPTIITKFQGLKKFFAYLKRPFDINIILLENFFADFGDFDRIFPYESTDNYKIICRLLEIKPPKSLRKAYAKNPYSIIWYMIFKQLGVKDINFMQKFFLIDDCITVMPLDEFRFIAESKEVVKMKYLLRWHAFEYFCKFMIKNKGEKFFMNWLYKFSTKENLTQNQIDTIQMFYKRENQISPELQKKLWKDGLTDYVHDMMSWEVRESLKYFKNVRVIFAPEILKYEAVINGYEFRLVRDLKTLYFVSLELENCVMSYHDRFLTQESIIVAVIKNKKCVACIEIQEKNCVVQALGVRNRPLEGELLFVFEIWTVLKNFLNFSEHCLNMIVQGEMLKILIDYHDDYFTPITQKENIEPYTDFGIFVGYLILKMWSV